MSRYIEALPDGAYKETLASTDQCKHLINDVCCHDKSPYLGTWPYEDECERCPLFQKEDWDAHHAGKRFRETS